MPHRAGRSGRAPTPSASSARGATPTARRSWTRSSPRSPKASRTARRTTSSWWRTTSSATWPIPPASSTLRRRSAESRAATPSARRRCTAARTAGGRSPIATATPSASDVEHGLMRRDDLERLLRDLSGTRDALSADPRFADLFASAGGALRLTRVVAHAHLWLDADAGGGAPRRALALALRDAWASYEDRLHPERVPDTTVAAAVQDAAAEIERSAGRAVARALGAIGDALTVYHSAIAVGHAGAAREAVQRRIAVALANAVWLLGETGAAAA